MQDTPVLIVGAGPTGLVLALRLARHGVPLRIIAKNTGPGQASRAMAVHARTLEFYQQLGIADEVVASGIKVEALRIRNGREEVAAIDFKEYGGHLSPFPFVLCYPQDDHERLLVRHLEAAGVSVEWGVALRSFTQDQDAVMAVLDKAGTPETCRAAYLCGCDGAHSTVRQGLALDFPGGSYDQLFYVADAKLAGDQDPSLSVSIGAHSFALKMPVRSSGMHRLIGQVPESLVGRTGITFDDIRPSAESLLGVQTEHVNWFSTYHVHHRVAAHFRAGRVFIAGDAGHVHSPAGGQGMNTGIGDAVNLSWKLADVLQGRAAPGLLDSYEPERIAFARKLVQTTDRAFQGIVGQGWGHDALRRFLIPYFAPVLTGFAAVRRAMFGTASQIRITYRAGPLSQGTAGEVRGGDRLPWVGAGGGNFAPFAELAWRIQVHGTATDALRGAASSLGVAVDEYAWTKEAAEAGLQRDAAYLVRPDMHVALALPDQDTATLLNYAGGIGLRPASSPAARP